MIADTTPGGLQLPHPDNKLEEDVLRLRAALMATDAAFANLAELVAQRATSGALDMAVAALGQRIDSLAEVVAFQGANKVGVVNGQAGPAVTLKPAHLGLGPANGASAIAVTRDGTGRLATVTTTLAGQPCVQTLGYDAEGRLSSITTTYEGRTRTETLSFDAGTGALNGLTATEVQA